MGSDHEVLTKVGRVVGAIEPVSMGEVMIPIRGGTEAFHAYAVDRTDEIAPGNRVLVIEYHPPRTVIVTPI